MSSGFAAWLGYDPDRVAELPPAQRRALAVGASAAVPGLLLLGGAAGYGAYLASDALALSFPVGLGAALYLLNLLRVAVAGGGVGPQQPLAVVTTWFPRTVPLVMLALLGVFFAQPLILGLLAHEQDPQIEVLRQSLDGLHAKATLRPFVEEERRAQADVQRAQAALDQAAATLDARQRELAGLRPGSAGRQTVERAVADDRRDLGLRRADVDRATASLQRARTEKARVQSRDVDPYRRSLGRSHFLLRRVQLTWQRPLLPLCLSIGMVVLMVLPWLASATLARRASRAYEAARWKANRALIDQAHRQARQEEGEALAAWPGFAGLRLELYEDAPYNTKPRAGAGAFEVRHG